MILNEEKIPFRIDAFSGNIYSTESLDREKVSTWQVEVIAADNGKFVQRSSIVIVTIEILDENDNPPLIHNDVFDLYISENAKTGQNIKYHKSIGLKQLNQNFKTIFFLNYFDEICLIFSWNLEYLYYIMYEYLTKIFKIL